MLLSEERIGRELVAGQERGEVAQAGDNPNVRAADNQVAALSEIGIPRQRAGEFKKIANGNGFIQAALVGFGCRAEGVP